MHHRSFFFGSSWKHQRNAEIALMVPNPRELCNSMHSLNTDWPQRVLAWVNKPDSVARLLEALSLSGLDHRFMLLTVRNQCGTFFVCLSHCINGCHSHSLGGCQATQVDFFLFLFAWTAVVSLGDATVVHHVTQVEFFVCFCLLEPLQCHIRHASCTDSSNFFQCV